MDSTRLVLAINGGSSSLKFAAFDVAAPHQRRLRGQFDRIGHGDGTDFHVDRPGDIAAEGKLDQLDHRSAAGYLLDWLERSDVGSIAAVGHRIVHGGARYRQHAEIDKEMLDELRRIVGYAPEHLPIAIDMIDVVRERLPEVQQVACFDTAFHAGLPAISRILPLPRRLLAQGVERYGFHGLSYTFLLDELREQGGAEAASGRVVLAHLGNGASLAAVSGGRSIDTSMGFTPAAGIPMSTRSGDLDPGLVRYLAQSEGWDAETFDSVINHQSGLLGVSETSSDVRDLLALEATDQRAAEALGLFCYAVKKTIGAYAAALGGIDTLVFSGGIGQNAATVRERICAGLEFLGINLDLDSNAGNAPIISTEEGRVAVRVIPSDEEAAMLRAVVDVLGQREMKR